MLSGWWVVFGEESAMHVYLKSESGGWAVGFYQPFSPRDALPREVPHMGLNYRWHVVREFTDEREAQHWTSLLNGGRGLYSEF